jgi:hypothetical protein
VLGSRLLDPRERGQSCAYGCPLLHGLVAGEVLGLLVGLDLGTGSPLEQLHPQQRQGQGRIKETDEPTSATRIGECFAFKLVFTGLDVRAGLRGSGRSSA